jgi:hypothetical protein
MNFKRLGYTALFSLSLGSQMGFAAPEPMVFKNNYGSILEISVADNTSVTGYFTTKVATKDCPQVINQKRPVVGFLSGNALTLSINYPDCGSAVSIIGNLKDDNKSIDTTWMIAHQLASANNLNAQFIGHQNYQRVTQ